MKFSKVKSISFKITLKVLEEYLKTKILTGFSTDIQQKVSLIFQTDKHKFSRKLRNN
jgi:hypothetical protein